MTVQFYFQRCIRLSTTTRHFKRAPFADDLLLYLGLNPRHDRKDEITSQFYFLLLFCYVYVCINFDHEVFARV